MRQNKFQATPELLQYIGDLFGMVGQTKLVEDGFHFERRGEGAQDKKDMSSERKWMLLLEKGIGSNIHKYNELDWQSMPLPRGMKDQPMSDVFAERPSTATMPFKDIISTSPKTPWWSPGPESESIQHADLALAMRFNADGRWDDGRFSWLAMLAKVPRLCMKHPDYGECFYFVVGNVCAEGVWGWLAKQVLSTTGQAAFCLDVVERPEDVQMLTLTTLQGWEAFEYQWLAPPALQRLGFDVPMVAASPKNPTTSLLKACALGAFGSLPLTPLMHLAKFVGMKMERGTNLFDLIWSLIGFCHPLMDDSEKWRIMQRRWHSHDLLTNLLPESLLDQVDEQDAAEVRLVKKKMETDDSETQAFKERFKVKRTEYVARKRAAAIEAAQAKRKRPGSTRGRAQVDAQVEAAGVEADFSGKRIPNAYKGFTDKTTAQEIAAHLPPEYTVFEDHFNARWQVRLGPDGSALSRSWGKYGFAGAGKLVVEEAWRVWEAQGNAPCPIRHLMPAAISSEAPAASASSGVVGASSGAGGSSSSASRSAPATSSKAT